MAELLRKEELRVKHFLKADAFGEAISICREDGSLRKTIDLVEDTRDFFKNIYEDASGNMIINGEEQNKTLDEWISEDDRIKNSLNCKLIFIEGYAGCGKSTLVQHVLYHLLKNENYEYSYYNYDIGSYQDDYNVYTSQYQDKVNNEIDFIKYSIIHSLKKQIVKLINTSEFEKIYNMFFVFMNNEDSLKILEATCKIRIGFGNSRVIRNCINNILKNSGNKNTQYISHLENIIEIKLGEFNIYQLLCIDYLWRLAQYCTNPKEYRGFMYVCYDNLDAIVNFEILSNFKEQLIVFRKNLNDYILCLNKIIGNFKIRTVDKIPAFIIFSTYRKITAIRSNSFNLEMLNDIMINEDDIKTIEVSGQYDFNKIAQRRLAHFSSKLMYFNLSDQRKEKLIRQMDVISDLKEMSFVESKYARLWNNNFRSCSNVLDELVAHKYIDAEKCIELCRKQIDGYNHEKYCYYGASALFLHAICKLLKSKHIFDKDHLDVIDHKSDSRKTCLSRLILTFIKNQNDSVSICDIFEKFDKAFNPREICRIIGQLLTRVSGEIWRRPIYYSKNALNNELNIDNVLYEQYEKYERGENYTYVEFKICDCGETYINDIIPHFEFYSIRINPNNKALYCIEDICDLKQILVDVYERIENCCEKQLEFRNSYTKQYEINDEEYMSIGFHPTTRSGNSQLHIERVIFAHINYLNRYRLYLNSKHLSEKFDELNDLVLEYIRKYLELYINYVAPISKSRHLIASILKEKLDSGDKYVSIEV